MGTVILRRLLTLLPLLFVLSIALFAMSLRLNPDRAAFARAGGIEATPEVVAQVRDELGLDDPAVVRYVEWVGDIVRLDFGVSLIRTEPVTADDGSIVRQGLPVWGEIVAALPKTLSIAFVGLAFGAGLGLVVGLIGGLRPGSLLDRISTAFATLGLAIPSFWLLMIFVLYFSVDRGWLPATGYQPLADGVWAWLRHILLPGIAVGTSVAAITARQLRSSMMNVMGRAYVRTAWAKGNSARGVVMRHALKNSLSAPLTTFGTMFAHMIGGTIVIETLVGITGIGTLTREAVQGNDITMLQGLVLLFAIVTVFVNLVTDLLYAYLNPKVRVS